MNKLKRIKRAWVFLPNLSRQMFNIYSDENKRYIKWQGIWWQVVYRGEYGEYETFGKIEEEQYEQKEPVERFNN